MQFLVQPKVRQVRAIAAVILGAVVSTVFVSGLQQSMNRQTSCAEPVLQVADRLTAVSTVRAEYTPSPDTFHWDVHCETFPSSSKKAVIDHLFDTALNGRQTNVSLAEAGKLMAPSEWQRFKNVFNLAQTNLYFVPIEWHWGKSGVTVNGNLVGMTLEEPFINNMYLTFYFSGDGDNCRIKGFNKVADPLLQKFLAGRTDLKLTKEAIDEHFAAQKELASHGERQRAIEHYDRAIKASPDFYFAYFCRGFEKSQLGDHDGAIADYTSAIKINPRFFSAYLNRSYEYNEIKHDFRKAISDCDMAIPSEPGQIKPYTNKAYAFCELHEYSNAIATCNQAEASVPAYASYYLTPVRNLRSYAASQLGLTADNAFNN